MPASSLNTHVAGGTNTGSEHQSLPGGEDKNFILTRTAPSSVTAQFNSFLSNPFFFFPFS